MAPIVIRAAERPSPVVAPGDGGPLRLTYLDLRTLAAGEEWRLDLAGLEAQVVPLSGRIDVEVGDERFEGVGGRSSVWDGPADSVYAGAGRPIVVTARGPAEVAVAGGRVEGAHAPFRVRPEEVAVVEVGSSETHSRRRICHLLGRNGEGRAGRLLVSELYAEAGCWSGYPPHKHDADRTGEDGAPEETHHEELYHYRFRPETGFGAQFLYADGASPRVAMTRHGDTVPVPVPGGYHPTVTSPGHEEYILTVLVGRTRRGLVQHFERAHAHLADVIPGIGGMRDAFR